VIAVLHAGRTQWLPRLRDYALGLLAALAALALHAAI
jgi:hypothetical protein